MKIDPRYVIAPIRGTNLSGTTFTKVGRIQQPKEQSNTKQSKELINEIR